MTQHRLGWHIIVGVLLVAGMVSGILAGSGVWGVRPIPAQAQDDRPPDDPETAAFITSMFTLQDRYSRVLCVHGDDECPAQIEVAVPCLVAACERPTLAYDVATTYETIQPAVEAAQPGDLVIVMAGTHNGIQIEETGGADGAYIHIMGWGAPGSVLVDAKAFEDKDWLSDHFYFIDAHHYIVSNITFADADRAGVFVSGYFSETGHFSHHFIFDSIYARDNGVWGLHTTSTSHIVIQDSIFVRSEDEHGTYISGSGDNVVIRRNVFQGNAASGLQVNADPQTATEEVFYYLQNTTGDTCGIGEDDAYAAGWQTVADCYAAQGLPDLGPYFEDGISEGLIIEQNIVTGNGDFGGAGINLASVRRSLVRNNLVYGNGAAAITCWDNAYAEEVGVDPSPFGCDDVTISNNTLVDPSGGRGSLILNQGARNMAVFNNIIVRDRFDAYEVAFNSGTNLRSAYNAYFTLFVEEAPGSVMIDSNPESGSLTGFSIDEALAQFVDAGFAPWVRLDTPWPVLNEARPDFHLRPDSPWAAAGLPDLSTPLDLFGTPRTGTELGALAVSDALAADRAGRNMYGKRATSPDHVIGGDASTSPARAQEPPPAVITYLLADDVHIYRITLADDPAPDDITALISALVPGDPAEEWLNVSPDSAWLLTSAERFDADCDGWACLTLIAADLSVVEVPRVDGSVIHAEGIAAVGLNAEMIVYAAGDGPHGRDLWALTRDGDAWNGPLLLTEDSPYAFHSHPAISTEGDRIVFDCHDAPYPADGSSLCLVNADATGFEVWLTPEDAPDGAGDGTQLHHADFAPDGSIVFEADWGGERLWRLAPDAADPVLITDQFSNDNSPCVLADGRIASLWLNREGGAGTHELKIMNADGTGGTMLVVDADVFDVGLGCGG